MEESPSSLNVSALLRARSESLRRDATLLAGRIERVSLARLATAALIVLAIAGAIAEPQRRAVFLPLVGVTIAGFAALVVHHRRLDNRRLLALRHAAVSEQGAFRADRLWPQIDPQPWTWPTDDDARQRVDLDVVGAESLVQLLPAISSGVGAPRIRAWFGTIADEEVIRARQSSVRELVDATELRNAFEIGARRIRISEAHIAAFVEWGSSTGRAEPMWMRIASLVLPAISIASIGASIVWPPAASIVVTSAFATLIFAYAVQARTREAIRAAETGAQIADTYAELAGIVRVARFESPLLRELQGVIDGTTSVPADKAFQRLQRLSAWAEVRSSPMQHALLQALFAWDCQIARAVERWRASSGAALDSWFSALAEIECLAALGGVASTNPTWVFPELECETPLRIHARNLGHPLLPDGGRVPNDVEIGPPGTVLLVSGSNMSGKSTLLRAIGLNVLLARVGGPVCADAMTCPPVRLFTSLRIQDSLAEGISYFMAEALRLRDIVFAAEASAGTGVPPVVYLVDEILRGTNSEERTVASRFIVARLLETPAIGAITTHDLGVFDVPEIGEHARHAHFAEQFTGGENERLIFDYRLRPGPATSHNALRLLSLIGLRRT